jgi:hypothetical protein
VAVGEEDHGQTVIVIPVGSEGGRHRDAQLEVDEAVLGGEHDRAKGEDGA